MMYWQSCAPSRSDDAQPAKPRFRNGLTLLIRSIQVTCNAQWRDCTDTGTLALAWVSFTVGELEQSGKRALSETLQPRRGLSN